MSEEDVVWDWSCPCGEAVTDETCGACGRWQCVRCQAIVAPKTGCPACHVGKLKTAVRRKTLSLTVFKAGVDAVWLALPDGARSTSWNEVDGAPAGGAEPFAFDPSVAGEARLEWTVHGGDLEQGILELSCECHAEAGPLWRRELDADALAAGGLAWRGEVEPPDELSADFPGGRIAGSHGPYELQLSVRRRRGRRTHPARAFTRLAVSGWIELVLEDEAARPVPSEPYELVLPTGEVRSGQLDERGRALVQGVPSGECRVRFPARDGEAWSRRAAWLEIALVDERGRPAPGEPYRVVLVDGSAREGELDERGIARLEGLDPGECRVSFPRLDGLAWGPKATVLDSDAETAENAELR